MRRIRSASKSRSANVVRATTGASISMGMICVALFSHRLLISGGTTAVNCLGHRTLRSNMTPPIRSGLLSEDLGSGVKPSVKITTSVKRSRARSMGLGGPQSISFLHWARLNELMIELELRGRGKLPVLTLRDWSEERTTYLSPQLGGTKHEPPFQLACWARI